MRVNNHKIINEKYIFVETQQNKYFTTYVICVALRFGPNFILLNKGK